MLTGHWPTLRPAGVYGGGWTSRGEATERFAEQVGGMVTAPFDPLCRTGLARIPRARSGSARCALGAQALTSLETPSPHQTHTMLEETLS